MTTVGKNLTFVKQTKAPHWSGDFVCWGAIQGGECNGANGRNIAHAAGRARKGWPVPEARRNRELFHPISKPVIFRTKLLWEGGKRQKGEPVHVGRYQLSAMFWPAAKRDL